MLSILEDTNLINAILADCCDSEPTELHPLDAAMVGGFEDDVFGEMYPFADEYPVDNPF